MRKLVLSLVFLIVSSVGFATATPTTSGARTVIDPDDSPGPLDLVYAQQRSSNDGRTLIFRLGTYEEWDAPTVEDVRNFRWIGVFFTHHRTTDGEWFRKLILEQDEGELTAKVYGRSVGGRPPQSEPLADNLRVWRPDLHSISVRFPARLLGKKPYRWAANSSFETIGEDDRGYPECNWEAAFSRPVNDFGKCTDFSPLVRG